MSDLIILYLRRTTLTETRAEVRPTFSRNEITNLFLHQMKACMFSNCWQLRIRSHMSQKDEYEEMIHAVVSQVEAESDNLWIHKACGLR